MASIAYRLIAGQTKERLTQILRGATRLCDTVIFKPRQVEVAEYHFVVVIFRVIYKILQLKTQKKI